MPGQTTEAVLLKGDLDDFLARCPAYDFLESAVAVCDAAGLRYANRAFAAFNGRVREAPEQIGRLPSLLDGPDFAAWLRQMQAGGEAQTRRMRVYYATRIDSELTFCWRPLVDAAGRRLGGLLTIGEESTAFDRLHLARLQESHRTLAARIKQLDQEKTRADQLVKLLLRDAPVAMLLLNERRQILQANRSAERLFGLPALDLVGRTCDTLVGCLDRYGQCPLLAEERIDGDLCQGRRGDGGEVVALRSGSLLDGQGGRVILEAFVDMTERLAAERRIEHLAHHDVLTGLLNRFSLEDRLEQALATARRERQALAVLFIDMDRFKTINDTLGHATGDSLLVEVGKRLRQGVRDSDIVARFGGDEFVAVLTDVDGARAAAHVADKILHSLAQPYDVGGKALRSTPSIGIALFPGDGADAGALLQNADSAMYHAKAKGRNNVQFYTDALNRVATERLRQEEELRTALEEDQFELHYQPQVDGGGACVGFEALVRWRHPRNGLTFPGDFIPVAEECGLIQPLGEWVIEEACRQLRAWRQSGLTGVTVAINLSADQLRARDLVGKVALALKKNGLSGSDIELEVTESVAMHDPDESVRRLLALRKLGIGLAIDDFGTGYSSLNYLKQLPIHSLKLDQSFVRDIETDPNDMAICTATIALAHNLGLSVVAEGVETAAQRDFLLAHGCDFLQGYLFSKPLPAAAAATYARTPPAR